MQDFKDAWKARIAGALNQALREAGIEGTVVPAQLTAEIPPQSEYGDLGFPLFGFAKLFRKGPPQIAGMVAELLAAQDASGAALPDEMKKARGRCCVKGPYLNVFMDRAGAGASILSGALDGPEFGRPGTLAGSRIMVEFSSPNTNKPLHLGHLRNDALGESVSRIFAACGANVRKVCIINDRGIHICKSMLAYKEHGEGKTPESEGVKGDHFVGDWYVRFSRNLKEETEILLKEKGPGGIDGIDKIDKDKIDKKETEAQAPSQIRAQELLRKWEAGDGETVKLWELMNGWTVDGMKETYARTGVSFDQYYFESQTYLLGKDEVLKGLEKGIFYRAEDGAVMVDLEAENIDKETKKAKKALLRKDGTSIYITQDIGTAIYRHHDWPFDRLVYVVGSEQQYHFQALFAILKKLDFDWARNLYHLSYGMVNLPEGRMKSREGTVVDADDLIDSLRDDALAEIREKDREEAVGDSGEVAEKVALGALHYYLLQVSPQKDMLFDPKESLSFNGNTGPYLQYMGARISALLRKAPETLSGGGAPDYALLSGDAEWELLKTVAAYTEAVAEAAAAMDPSRLAAYLYELSRNFSRFYHDCPVLNAAPPSLARARLDLCRAVERVLRDALRLICIPFLETM